MFNVSNLVNNNFDDAGSESSAKENRQTTNGSVARLRQLYGDQSVSKSAKKTPREKISDEAAAELLQKKVNKLIKKGLLHYPSYSMANLAQRYELMFSLGNEIANYKNPETAFAEVNRILQNRQA